jgi:hypothetical protein
MAPSRQHANSVKAKRERKVLFVSTVLTVFPSVAARKVAAMHRRR